MTKKKHLVRIRLHVRADVSQMWSDRVVLVTGASRGIGAAFCKRVAAEGARVILTGRSVKEPIHSKLQGTLNDLASEIRTRGGETDVFSLDVRDDLRARDVVEEVVQRHGRLDVVVNNASAIDVSPTPLIKSASLMLNVNTRGTMAMNLAAFPHLERCAGQILSLSPPLDNIRRWLPFAPPYAVSKYGMTMATIGFAGRVKANCLWPKRTIATAATEMLESHSGQPYYSAGRPPSYFADAMLAVLNDPATSGQTLLDEDVLAYEDDPKNLAPIDLFVDTQT